MFIKTTARKLVHDRLGDGPIGSDAVREAVDAMLRRGWVNNYVPGGDYDRNLVFLRQNHAFAAIFRCLDANGCGVVPRGLIESRTRIPLSNTMTGIWLSRYGLAIVALDGGNVALRGTSSGMASVVNLSRKDILNKMLNRVLVAYATGLDLRTEHLNDDLRLRAALAYDDFQVDVPGLIDGGAESDVLSRWKYPPEPPPPQISYGPYPPPNPPPAPTDVDPDIPPF